MFADAMVVAAGTLAGVVVLAVLAAVAAVRSPAAILRRLGLEGDTVDVTAPVPGHLLTGPGTRAVGPAVSLEASSRLRRQLVWAGLRGETAPQVFLLTKALLAAGAISTFLVVNMLRAEPIRMALPVAVWLSAAAYFVPNLWLRSRVASRQRKVERALPDALDLLVTCVEAGLGLDAALQRVADEIELAWPLLSRELRLAFLEVKAGIPRMEAFRRLADRTGSAELRSLSATLNQTEMFGTSVGVALRVQADSIRIRRMQRAEELAAYVAVKMTFPLILFILPSLFVVVVGPAVVNIAEKLFPVLGGR
jgi:tight adherence protein C